MKLTICQITKKKLSEKTDTSSSILSLNLKSHLYETSYLSWYVDAQLLIILSKTEKWLKVTLNERTHLIETKTKTKIKDSNANSKNQNIEQ